jgi:transcriptional regulator with XRE-family HTH domain
VPLSRIDEMVGSRIRFRRLELSLTAPQLAIAAKVTSPQIDDYEAGRQRVPAERLLRLCHALGVRALYFFGITVGPERTSRPLELL